MSHAGAWRASLLAPRRCGRLLALACAVAICWAAVPAAAAGNAANAACSDKSYPVNATLTPVDFATDLAELRWLGWDKEGDKYVVAITNGFGSEIGGEVYLSDDYGAAASWRNLTDELEGLMTPETRTSRFLRGAVAVHHNPAANATAKIFVQGAAFHNWISEDYGKSWRRVDSPGQTLGYWTQVKLHPSQPDWMLALVRRQQCQFQATALDKWCASDLFVTQDFGASWANLTANSGGRIASFVDFDWGAYLKPWGDKSRQSDETIFATAYEDPHHLKGPLPAWDRNVHYVRSDDFFKTPHEKVVSCGNQFDIIAHKVYVAVPSNCPYHADGRKRKLSAADTVSSSVIMYESDDEGATFTESCLPVGDLDLGYRLRSNFFGQGAFLEVHHGSQSVAAARAPVANVYSSGGNSSLFSLALARAFRRGSAVDFTPVDGLPGMYIANLLGLSALEDAAFRWDAGAIEWEQYVKTMVSYNGGAHWNLLRKPAAFRSPRCDRCSQLNSSWECQLHLHGPSSWHATAGKMPGMHSHLAAPGLVMAVGNVGEYLDFAADASCTFLSRDGGESWEDVAEWASVFEFGDQGGLLVMARHQTQGPTDHVLFSRDEGLCWQRVNLSEAIDVINIRVEPTASSQVFLVHGQACERSERHPTCSHTQQGTRPAGKLYALDFEKLLAEDWKVCGDDAYETWSVPTPERCLLGRNITLPRRRRDAACFNGRGWQRPAGVHSYCNCTSVDVECEFGFEWSYAEHSCVPMAGVEPRTCPLLAPRGPYQPSATHLRLLSGDACVNVSSIVPDTDGRGHANGGRGRRGISGWAAAALALLVMAGVVVGAARYLQRTSDPDASFASLLATPFAAARRGVRWAAGRLTGRSYSGNDGYFEPLGGDDFDASPMRH